MFKLASLSKLIPHHNHLHKTYSFMLRQTIRGIQPKHSHLKLTKNIMLINTKINTNINTKIVLLYNLSLHLILYIKPKLIIFFLKAMEKNHESKASLTEKQPQYYPGTINRHALEVVNLGHYSLSQQNPNSQSSNISDPILPFAVSTAARLFQNNLSMSPGNDDSTTDDSREIGRGRDVGVGVVVNNERRLKRMISNRESARRSRMRRKMQIEELQYLVGQLQTTNRQLSEKLIQLLDCNQQILQENSQLKEKVSSLQIILSDLLVPLRNNAGEDHNSSADRMLKAQGSSTPSVTISSMQLLH